MLQGPSFWKRLYVKVARKESLEDVQSFLDDQTNWAELAKSMHKQDNAQCCVDLYVFDCKHSIVPLIIEKLGNPFFPPVDAVHWACRSPRPLHLQQLIEAGANLEARNNMYMTPLLVACSSKSIECMELLLMAGVSLDARDCFGRGVKSYATTTFFLNAAMKEMAKKPVECLQRAALYRRFGLLALFFE